MTTTVEDWADDIMARLDQDIPAGFAWGRRIAPDVTDFAQLHDYCDANQVYLLDVIGDAIAHLGDDPAGRAATELANAVTAEVSRRLAERAPRLTLAARRLLSKIEVDQSYGTVPLTTASTGELGDTLLTGYLAGLGLDLEEWTADAVRLLVDEQLAAMAETCRTHMDAVLAWCDPHTGPMSLGMLRAATCHLPDDIMIVLARHQQGGSDDGGASCAPIFVVTAGRWDGARYTSTTGSFTATSPDGASAICFWPAH
jgi:hypothetical protein